VCNRVCWLAAGNGCRSHSPLIVVFWSGDHGIIYRVCKINYSCGFFTKRGFVPAITRSATLYQLPAESDRQQDNRIATSTRKRSCYFGHILRADTHDMKFSDFTSSTTINSYLYPGTMNTVVSSSPVVSRLSDAVSEPTQAFNERLNTRSPVVINVAIKLQSDKRPTRSCGLFYIFWCASRHRIKSLISSLDSTANQRKIGGLTPY
jgi:hypothetical protein